MESKEEIEYEDYILEFPKQHCLTTILYTLALHPLLTRTAEMDEIGCSLGIVGCVRSTEDTLWDLGSREISFFFVGKTVGQGLLFHEGPTGSISARFRRSFAVQKESLMFFTYLNL